MACPRRVSALAALFGVSGVLHLVRPRLFETIVPRPLPAKRALVHVSGVAELACSAGLVLPVTRRAAGLASAGLMVLVFPANVQMALDLRRRGGAALALALVRLPLQVPLVVTAWRAWRPGDVAAVEGRGGTRLRWPRI